MLQTAQKKLVPLSHVYRGGTAGQDRQGGTSLGTRAGQHSLKALAHKHLRCPTQVGQVGQGRDKTQKSCPTLHPPVGQENGAEKAVGQRHVADRVTPSFVDPTPLPVDWAPDAWEGRPCCYLPHVPERLRGILPFDLQGMGIPAEGLPAALRGFSRSGWRLALEKGDKLRMVAAVRDARNENGCRGYLRVNRAAVLRQLKMWEESQCMVSF